AQTVNPAHLIDLGVTDEVFLSRLAAAMKSKGLVLIYNLCPAPAPLSSPQFLPWSDGRSPFSRTQWERAGFEVLALDTDDTPFARKMGKALGWDMGEEKMDLEHDLFAWFS